MIAAISLALPSPPPPFAAAMPGFADVLAEQAPVPVKPDRFAPMEESEEDDEVPAVAPIFATIVPPVTDTVAAPPASLGTRRERAASPSPVAPLPVDPDDRPPATRTTPMTPVPPVIRHEDEASPIRLDDRVAVDLRPFAPSVTPVGRHQIDQPAATPPPTGHPGEGQEPVASRSPTVEHVTQPGPGLRRDDNGEQRLSPPATALPTPPAVRSGAPSFDSGIAKSIDAAPGAATTPARSTALPPVALFAAPKPLTDPVTPPARAATAATLALAARTATTPTDPAPVAPGDEPRVGGPRSALAAAHDRPASDRPPAAPAAESRVPDPAAMTQPVAPPIGPAIAPPVKEPLPHADPARASATTPDVTVTTPALGAVSAAVTARPGDTERLSVHFAVEREATAALIATGDGLGRALALAGATLDTVSVEVRGDRSDGGTGDPRADAHAQPHARDGQPEARRRLPARPASPPSPPAPARRDRFA